MATTVDGIPVGGSAGKITWGRNRYGAYTRRRTKPVNPDSTRQQRARSDFRAAIDNWTNTLTAPQRLAWTTYAQNVPWLNRAGETTHLTGQAAYIRCATFWLLNGDSITNANAAPAIFDISSIAITAAMVWDISSSIWNLTLQTPILTNGWNSTVGALQVLMSTPANVSVNFRPNRFAFLAKQTVPDPATATYLLTFTAAQLPFSLSSDGGQRVWFKLRGCTPDNRVTESQLVGPVLTATQA